ncbi:hypothetical protein Ccrd_001419 [Cynara cardunculus var. scolymus]|uniref:Uncharacterized protein n=1 Tax=Cynara cardunculus var. scolymus TaxID=59895 RepID=A0A103XTC8_CYNCS|nr:hypothetical protein Ccrd_001419 [Cynara cardunculus var. scolymus]
MSLFQSTVSHNLHYFNISFFVLHLVAFSFAFTAVILCSPPILPPHLIPLAGTTSKPSGVCQLVAIGGIGMDVAFQTTERDSHVYGQ